MRNSTGTKPAKHVSLADVLPHMKPGRGYTLANLAKTVHRSRHFLDSMLAAAVRAGDLESRIDGDSLHEVFYLAGSAPPLQTRAYRPDEALPISVHPASTSGELTGYGAMLTRQRDLSMLTRRG